MDKGILRPGRRAKISCRAFGCGAEGGRAAVNLFPDLRGARAPEGGARMHERMVREGMTAREDFRDQVRIFFRVCTYDEKRGARFKAVQTIEELYGVSRRRPIIDC